MRLEFDRQRLAGSQPPCSLACVSADPQAKAGLPISRLEDGVLAYETGLCEGVNEEERAAFASTTAKIMNCYAAMESP